MYTKLSQDISVGMHSYHAYYTDNPLYTDTWYKYKICYNDNSIVMKTSLKR